MFEKAKANIFFDKSTKRDDINKSYAMVNPDDSWYDTITTIHKSLDEIQKLPHETLEIRSDDGLNLKAIYYPHENGSDVTVICIHGLKSHAEREFAFPGLFYHSLGFNVLIIYQRAHGLSEGERISFGVFEHLDVMRWVDKINEINPDGKIILHGLSMGGGVVLNLTNKTMKNVKLLITDAPAKSIVDLISEICGQIFKKNPDKICKYVLENFKTEFKVDPAEFDLLKFVSECKYPLFLTAGSDEKMDEFLSELKNLNPQETQLIILPDCQHANGMYKQTELYQKSLKEFINKHL